MTDIMNLKRELEKAREVLKLCELYLARHAEMNAAIHCSEKVMYSPLHSRVQSSLYSVERYLDEVGND
jgi:hypothetical protein